MRDPRSKSKPNIIFGIHPVLESFEGDKEIEKVFLLKGTTNKQLQEIRHTCQRLNIPVSDVPMEKLNRITGKNHQGVIAYVSPITYASIDAIIDQCYREGKDPFILVLDRITDVRNFGAITRTAECMGVDAILVPAKGGALVNADAEKSAAGALNYIPVARAKYLDRALEELIEYGLKLVACTEKSEKTIDQVDFAGPLAIIMGSEEDGISGKYLSMCHDRAGIPMYGQVPSLNVSVAAGMVLYQANLVRKPAPGSAAGKP